MWPRLRRRIEPDKGTNAGKARLAADEFASPFPNGGARGPMQSSVLVKMQNRPTGLGKGRAMGKGGSAARCGDRSFGRRFS